MREIVPFQWCYSINFSIHKKHCSFYWEIKWWSNYIKHNWYTGRKDLFREFFCCLLFYCLIVAEVFCAFRIAKLIYLFPIFKWFWTSWSNWSPRQINLLQSVNQGLNKNLQNIKLKHQVQQSEINITLLQKAQSELLIISYTFFTILFLKKNFIFSEIFPPFFQLCD